MRTPGPAFSTLRLSDGHQAAVGFRGIEKIQDVGLKKIGQLAQGSDRGGHLRALERTKEPEGDPDFLGDLGQGESALGAQTAQMGANASRGALRLGRTSAVLLQHLHDRGSVHATHPAQKARALEHLHVLFENTGGICWRYVADG